MLENVKIILNTVTGGLIGYAILPKPRGLIMGSIVGTYCTHRVPYAGLSRIASPQSTT